MKRVNLDNKVFVDLDKLVLVQVEKVDFVSHERQLRDGFKVVGVTDAGLKIDLFGDMTSGKPDACNNWITQNWMKR